VTQDELDRLERMAGKDSSVYQCLAEQRTAYVAWEAERDREETRLRQARESRQAEAAKERADAREAERAAAMDALKAGLRDRFFRANREATESDYAMALGTSGAIGDFAREGARYAAAHESGGSGGRRHARGGKGSTNVAAHSRSGRVNSTGQRGGSTTINIEKVELRDEQDIERGADDNQRMTRLQTRHG
jgi:hypothetical protein